MGFAVVVLTHHEAMKELGGKDGVGPDKKVVLEQYRSRHLDVR